MNEGLKILFAILVMTGLGFILGLAVSFFSSKFQVVEDNRLTEITALLPGANCGACGAAGCHDFAKKILEKKADQNGCKVIKGDAKQKLGDYIETNIK